MGKRTRQTTLPYKATKRTKYSKSGYKKKASKYKKKYKSLKRSGRLNGKAKKIATSHWLSFGKSSARNFGKKLSGMLKQITAPNIATVSDSGYINIPQGKQVYVNVCNAYTPYDILNVSGDTTTTKVYLDGCYQTTTYTNQNNFNVFIDVHDVGTKIDVQTASSGTTPSSAITTAAAQTGGTFEAPGQSLLGASTFVNMYSILKTTRLCLGAGETWNHVVNHNPDRMLTGAMMQPWSTAVINTQGIKGLTYYQLMVVYGGPVDLATATSALTGVTTGGVDSGNAGAALLSTPHISWITTKTYTYRSITDNTQNNASTNNLTTNTNYATYHVMEKDGDNQIETVG